MSTNSKFHGVEVDVGERLEPTKPSNTKFIIGSAIIAISIIIGVVLIGMNGKPTEQITPIDLSIVPEKEFLMLNAPQDIDSKVIISADQTSVGCTTFSCKEYTTTPNSGRNISIDWALRADTPFLIDEIRLEICCDFVDTSIHKLSTTLEIPKTVGWIDVKSLSAFTEQDINGRHIFTFKQKDWLISDDYYPMNLYITDVGQFNDFPYPNALQFTLNIITKNPHTGNISTHYDSVNVFYYEGEKYSYEDKVLMDKLLDSHESVVQFDARQFATTVSRK